MRTYSAYADSPKYHSKKWEFRARGPLRLAGPLRSPTCSPQSPPSSACRTPGPPRRRSAGFRASPRRTEQFSWCQQEQRPKLKQEHTIGINWCKSEKTKWVFHFLFSFTSLNALRWQQSLHLKTLLINSILEHKRYLCTYLHWYLSLL